MKASRGAALVEELVDLRGQVEDLPLRTPGEERVELAQHRLEAAIGDGGFDDFSAAFLEVVDVRKASAAQHLFLDGEVFSVGIDAHQVGTRVDSLEHVGGTQQLDPRHDLRCGQTVLRHRLGEEADSAILRIADEEEAHQSASRSRRSAKNESAPVKTQPR